MLPDIINVDQTGYVKGRYVGENIRLIQDVLHYTSLTNEKGIAIFLDFKKAFDMIEWTYLDAALGLFNFGPDIMSWIKIVYKDVSSCVVNNGHASTTRRSSRLPSIRNPIFLRNRTFRKSVEKQHRY